MDQEHSKPSFLSLGVFGVFFGAISGICLPFISPAFRKYCIPYIPATNKQVNNVIKVCKQIRSKHSNQKGLKVCDLGSGDGRLILELAKCGIHGSGYELNPWLVLLSKFSSYSRGVNKVAEFHRRNLWNVELTRYDVIIIFGVQEMMQELELKLNSELRHGSFVISGRFPLSKATREVLGEGAERIWVYSY